MFKLYIVDPAVLYAPGFDGQVGFWWRCLGWGRERWGRGGGRREKSWPHCWRKQWTWYWGWEVHETSWENTHSTRATCCKHAQQEASSICSRKASNSGDPTLHSQRDLSSCSGTYSCSPCSAARSCCRQSLCSTKQKHSIYRYCCSSSSCFSLFVFGLIFVE